MYERILHYEHNIRPTCLQYQIILYVYVHLLFSLYLTAPCTVMDNKIY